MVSSRDGADDAVADPAFGPGDGQVVTGYVQIQHGTDVGDVLSVDAVQLRQGRVAAEQSGCQYCPREESYHAWRLAAPGQMVRRPGQVEVVDGGDRQSVPVVDLPVEQVQARIDQPSADGRGSRQVGAHAPCRVMTIRGIAAIEATRMMTR